MVNPKVSVVITSYTLDRINDIFEVLDSIRKQTYQNIETIFVAEFSKELLEQVTTFGSEKDIPGFKVIFNDGTPGASAARNLGIINAKGDIIAFIDDDAVADSDWVENMAETYRDESVIAVTGPAYPLWTGKPATWFPEEFYWILSCTSWAKWDGITEVRNIWLQNGSFRREAFEVAGALSAELGPVDSIFGFKGREFTDGVISEEVELSLRVRKATQKRIVYNPEMKVKHRVDNRRLKLGYISRWSYWMGYSKQRMRKLYTEDKDDILSQEHKLLKRIITQLLPGMVTNIFSNPSDSFRTITVIFISLSCISAGYLVASFLPVKQNGAHNSQGCTL